MKSVPISSLTDKVERTLEDLREYMTLNKAVIDSLTNNNRKLNLNEVMNHFKSESFFTIDDFEKYKSFIIEYVN